MGRGKGRGREGVQAHASGTRCVPKSLRHAADVKTYLEALHDVIFEVGEKGGEKGGGRRGGVPRGVAALPSKRR
jgi:hypothetical protein